jgi:hypothetical protein
MEQVVERRKMPVDGGTFDACTFGDRLDACVRGTELAVQFQRGTDDPLARLLLLLGPLL